MNSSPDRPLVRVSSVAGLLATVPHLLGFTPESSFVIVGATRADRVQVAFRYDLPDPPDTVAAAEIVAHAVGVLAHHRLAVAVAVGYGPGRLVTPLADALRAAAPSAGLWLRDVIRVEADRYWSYLCTDPLCCPAEGVVFDPGSHPVAKALTAAGRPVLPGREAVAATIAPLTGPAAEAMQQATHQAERAARRLIASGGPKALEHAGLTAAHAAIGVYRNGGSLAPAIGFAWLALALTRMRIRDDAWARMDPEHREAHRRLWTELVRRAQPGYVAAPASLLAVTAWQTGDGALANIALDRALNDAPGYSMALVLREGLDSGAPPSLAVPPMTPDQVAAAYTNPDATSAGPGDPATGMN
jgi:Domain of unknown function (DUF4192)